MTHHHKLPAPPQRTYVIAIDRSRITCLVCGRTSHHPGDVENKYCGNCHAFHPIQKSPCSTLSTNTNGPKL